MKDGEHIGVVQRVIKRALELIADKELWRKARWRLVFTDAEIDYLYENLDRRCDHYAQAYLDMNAALCDQLEAAMNDVHKEPHA